MRARTLSLSLSLSPSLPLNFSCLDASLISFSQGDAADRSEAGQVDADPGAHAA